MYVCMYVCACMYLLGCACMRACVCHSMVVVSIFVLKCILQTVYFFVQTEEYATGWNTKITPLGDQLLSLNAVANGIAPLQQASM